jgi:hypothetical protein
MNTPTESDTPLDRETKAAKSNAEMVMGFAVLGCLMAGGVGIWKALTMISGLDVLLCLLARWRPSEPCFTFFCAGGRNGIQEVRET